MQILVIGGLGYIGSRLLDSLSRHRDYKDCDIVVVDSWAYGRGMPPLLAYFKDRFRRFRHHCLDISDAGSDRLRDIVGNSRYIVNCASLTQIPNSELHQKYIVDGVANLSRTIVDTGPDLGKVIDISSTSIYGPVRSSLPGTPEPYTEDVYPDPEIALHNYAASKLRAEKIWQSNERGGIPVTVFRLSTVFGHAVGMRYNQFVNQFLVDAVAGRRTVLPGSPGNFRPYVHVGDVAELMLHLFDNAPETNGHVVNVGAGRLNPEHGALFASLAEMLKNQFDIEADYAFASDLGHETIEESYRVNFTKFETMVGFPLRHDFLSGGRDLVGKIVGG